MFRASRSHSHRSRTERVLRFALRRKPCVYLVFIELALIVILLGSLFLLSYYVISNLHNEQSLLVKEDEILKRYEMLDHKTCPLSTRKEVNYANCVRGCGSTAQVLRHYRNDNSKCLEFVDSTSCSDREECVPAMNITQCHGKNGVPMPKHWKKHEDVYAPRIDLKDYNNTVLQSQEIIMRCPICRALTRFFKTKEGERCRRKLTTVKEGWPIEFATCDNYEYTDDPNCELV